LLLIRRIYISDVLAEYVAVCVGCAGWICSCMCRVCWLNL